MTAKRDLKRRVRERQAKTGESYVTARRHVIAQAPTEKTGPAMEVVEMSNVSDAAAKLGLKCGVLISPALAAEVELTTVLARLRDVLVGTDRDPTMAEFSELALGIASTRQLRRRRTFEDMARFFQRARAGLGGTTDDGRLLSFPVVGHAGLVVVLCTAWQSDRSLVLTTLEEHALPEGNRFVMETQAIKPIAPRTLYLVFDGKRYPVTDPEHVIGRAKSCDLQIRDGVISRRHAAVISRNNHYYIKDLSSTGGIHYRGLRIDNKRIDEGDVFALGSYELRFTFLDSD